MSSSIPPFRICSNLGVGRKMSSSTPLCDFLVPFSKLSEVSSQLGEKVADLLQMVYLAELADFF
jgi:hypothetical protein